MPQSNNVIASMVNQALIAQHNAERHAALRTPDGRRDSILKLRDQGKTYLEIARDLHVSRETIRAVIRGVGTNENPLRNTRTIPLV